MIQRRYNELFQGALGGRWDSNESAARPKLMEFLNNRYPSTHTEGDLGDLGAWAGLTTLILHAGDQFY